MFYIESLATWTRKERERLHAMKDACCQINAAYSRNSWIFNVYQPSQIKKDAVSRALCLSSLECSHTSDFPSRKADLSSMQTDVGLRGWFIENQMSTCKGWKCLWRTESQINVWDLIHTLSIKSLSAKKETLLSASPKSTVHRFQTYMFGRGPRLREGRKSPAGGLPTNHESIRDCALPLCVPVWSR